MWNRARKPSCDLNGNKISANSAGREKGYDKEAGRQLMLSTRLVIALVLAVKHGHAWH